MANFSAIVILDKLDNIQPYPDMYRVAYVTPDFKVDVKGMAHESEIVAATKTLQAINFNTNNGKVVDEVGKFSRLKDNARFSPRIVLAEIVTESKRLLGYVLLNKAGQIETVKRADLLNICSQAKRLGASYLQNAIYKEVDGKGAIASYPNKPFNRIVNRVNKTDKKPVSQVDKARNKENLSGVAKYTPEQMKELSLAEEHGVNKILIANPKLTPKQMRILWVAKKNGMASEYFANPKFSEDVMKFFADRLVNKKMFSECKALFKVGYDVKQLTELYLGIYSGIDISKYADQSISGEDMYFKRVQMESEYYKKPMLDFGEKAKDENIGDCVDSFLKKRGK